MTVTMIEESGTRRTHYLSRIVLVSYGGWEIGGDNRNND